MAYDDSDSDENQSCRPVYRIRDTKTGRTSRPHTWWIRQLTIAEKLAVERGRPMEVVILGLRHASARFYPDGRVMHSDELWREATERRD
jgi:hypothetical protein